MSRCDVCGKQENMPYHCRHCGGTFCSEHRLPENHECPGLKNWNDPGGVFDSGFDDSVDAESSGGNSGSVASRVGLDTGPGGFLGYFRGNMTYVFLGVMWVTFLLKEAFLAFVVGIDRFGRPVNPEAFELYRAIFFLSSDHPEYVWTWVTSIFSHADIFHIALNSIVIFFFGRIVEDYIGSRDFSVLFVISGILAGLGQIGISMIQTPGVTSAVLGASGAALAIMGVLTVLNPNLKVYLYFILPVPLWLLTIGFAALNILGAFGATGSGVANVAHLVGLAIGLLYGQRIKDKIRAPNQIQFGGGGPGGPGGPGGRRRGPF